MSDASSSTNYLFGGIFLFLALVLLSFQGYLRFFVLSDLGAKMTTEQKSIETIKTESSSFLKPELKTLFERYSLGITAVDAVMKAREEVFTGKMDEEEFEPVMILPYKDFFKDFQKLLKKTTTLQNLSIDSFGVISFLVKTPSYHDAAEQLLAFDTGLVVEEGLPPLLTKLEVSSVAQQQSGGIESSFSYDFIVQARINPEYYQYLNEQKEKAAEEAGEEKK